MTEQNEDLIPVQTLDDESKSKIEYLLRKGILQKYKSKKYVCFSLSEYQNHISQLKPLPSDAKILTKEMDNYKTILYHMNKNHITRYKTDKDLYYSPSEYKKYIETKAFESNKKAYQIDLSQNAKINCLYKRLVNMNKSNKAVCQRDDLLQRYKDQDGYTCINLKEYLRPQIKLIAKKLECKENLVFLKIYELMQEIHSKRKDN